jgi:hypothetical protein
VLLAIGLAAAVWLVQTPEAVMRLMSEQGPVETSTATLFFVLALGLYWLRPAQDDRRSWLAMAGLCAAAGAREMDWHTTWAGKSMLKVSFYLGPAPWLQKLMAFVILMLATTSFIYLLNRHARRLWRALPEREPVATLLITTAMTKVIDRAVNLLAVDHGVAVALPVRALALAMEESMELSLPLMVALALWQYLRARRC